MLCGGIGALYCIVISVQAHVEMSERKRERGRVKHATLTITHWHGFNNPRVVLQKTLQWFVDRKGEFNSHSFEMIPRPQIVGFRVGIRSHSCHGAVDSRARLDEFTASSVSQHSTLNTICCARVQPARKSEPRHLILKPRWATPPSFHPPAPPEGESVFLDSRSLCRKHPIVLVHLVLNLFLPASRMISAASPRFVLLTAATICINFLHL